jgi:glutamate/tyrosine decarboxylase-like PLP-dependent enzyme
LSKPDQEFDVRLLDVINTYLAENRDSDTPVTEFLSPEELRARLNLELAERGCRLEDLYGFVEDYLKYSVRTGHRQYFNQLWSGSTLPGFLGEVIAALANTSMYTHEVAPVATLLEKELIRKMGRLAGFRNPEGLFLTGGSNGNLQAMLLARHRRAPDIKDQGASSAGKLAVFVSEEAHYSFEKAANVLGVGEAHVIKVKTDDAGRMLPDDLERRVERSRDSGLTPFFVGATAGTTVKGAFDPFLEIAALARGNNLWMHVDGSLGGTALLSPRHRGLLEGLEEADSFIWNAHKLMGLPLICSIFLVREQGWLHRANSVRGAEYIFHDEAYGASDLGPLSLQCGRRVDALKLWLSWMYYGDQGYAERVDRLFELTEYAEQIVRKTPELELMAPRSSVTLCFRYRTPDSSPINEFNLKLREELARSGKSLVNFTRIGGQVVIRLVLAHPELARSDVDLFFRNLMTTAENLVSDR